MPAVWGWHQSWLGFLRCWGCVSAASTVLPLKPLVSIHQCCHQSIVLIFYLSIKNSWRLVWHCCKYPRSLVTVNNGYGSRNTNQPLLVLGHFNRACPSSPASKQTALQQSPHLSAKFNVSLTWLQFWWVHTDISLSALSANTSFPFSKGHCKTLTNCEFEQLLHFIPHCSKLYLPLYISANFWHLFKNSIMNSPFAPPIFHLTSMIAASLISFGVEKYFYSITNTTHLLDFS